MGFKMSDHVIALAEIFTYISVGSAIAMAIANSISESAASVGARLRAWAGSLESWRIIGIT